MKNITQSEIKRNARLSPERKSELRAKVETAFAAFMEKFGFSGRQLTKKDFLQICKAEGIRILTFADDTETGPGLRHLFKDFPEVKGSFSRYKDMKFVYLRSLMLKKFDRFTAFHELGHYFLEHRSPGYRLKIPVSDPEHEFQADYFALLALGQAEVWQ